MTTLRGPVAGRLRRPGWRDPRLLIGLALIALSLVAVATTLRSADATEPYYAARHTLTPGTVVTESDVVVVHVRISDQNYVPVDADPPWGSVVTRTVAGGELVPSAALVEPEDFSARPVPVRTSLPLSESIGPGAIVDVWLTVDTDAGPQSQLVAEALVVDQVERAEGALSVGGSETVYVVVPTDQMAHFLDAVSTEGEISVVGLPGTAS